MDSANSMDAGFAPSTVGCWDEYHAARSCISSSESESTIADIVAPALAAWYSSQQPTVLGANPASIELAESIYRGGNKELSVAACSACHSPTGRGNAPAGFPAIGGQHPEYTLLQLKDFRAGARQNDTSAMMRTVVERLTDKELEALASYVSGLN